MKIIKLTGISLFLTFKLCAQGTNNDFGYDKEDINVIFKELGISTFKFPIKQNTGQLVNIIFEEYENRELLQKISIIDDIRRAFEEIGVDGLSYFNPQKDSIYFHRFYFFKNDSIVKIRLKAHGVEAPKEFDLKGKSLYAINTDNGIDVSSKNDQYVEVGDESKILLYLYANSIEEKDKPLWCPNGLSKEQLIERFHYFIFVSVELYKEE